MEQVRGDILFLSIAFDRIQEIAIAAFLVVREIHFNRKNEVTDNFLYMDRSVRALDLIAYRLWQKNCDLPVVRGSNDFLNGFDLSIGNLIEDIGINEVVVAQRVYEAGHGAIRVSLSFCHQGRTAKAPALARPVRQHRMLLPWSGP